MSVNTFADGSYLFFFFFFFYIHLQAYKIQNKNWLWISVGTIYPVIYSECNNFWGGIWTDWIQQDLRDNMSAGSYTWKFPESVVTCIMP